MSLLSAGTAGTLSLAQQQEQRFQQLSHIASAEGLIGPNHVASVPNGLKTGFARVVDFLSRPNFAIAGMFDVLQGTSDRDETAGGRILRELFSGLPGVHGSKEVFGDVLEQGGAGEGGRLSDLLGQNWLTQRLGFDPTLRGTMGLALDIFADPTTYITFGSNGLMRVVTSGGKAQWLTKAASKPVRDAARVRWSRLAKQIDTWEGLGYQGVEGRLSKLWSKEAAEDVTQKSWADRLDDAIKAGDDEAEDTIMYAIERRIISKKWDRALRGDIHEMRTGWLKGKIDEAARKDALKFAEGENLAGDLATAFNKADPEEFIAKRRVRFMGQEIPGVSEPLAEGYGKLKATIDDAIESHSFLKATKAEADKVTNAVGKFFNRDWGLRHLPGVKIYMQQMRNNYAGHRRRIDKELFEIFGEDDTTTEMWQMLTRAIDDPTKYTQEWVAAARKAGFDQEWAIEKMERVTVMFQRSADLDVHLGVLDPRLVRDDYMPHQVTNRDMLKDTYFTEFLTQRGKRRGLVKGPDIGGYSEPRHFDTLDEMQEAIDEFKAANPDADVALELDPRKLIRDRLSASARGWERSKFINKLRSTVKRNYRKELSTIIEKEMPHLRDVVRTANFTDDEARVILDAFEAELTYWKQPTSQLTSTPTGVRVVDAPGDARAPHLRRPAQGAGGQAQMRNDAITRMANEEYEARPLVKAMRTIDGRRIEAESARNVHAAKAEEFQAKKRTLKELKDFMSDAEMARRKASVSNRKGVAHEKAALAVKEEKLRLWAELNETQRQVYDMTRDDLLAQAEILSGRELGELRKLEDEVEDVAVLADSDEDLWGMFTEYVNSADNTLTEAALENPQIYRHWLAKNHAQRQGQIGTLKAAKRRLTDIEMQTTPLAERSFVDFRKGQKTRQKMMLDVTDARYNDLTLGREANPQAVDNLVDELAEGKEPVVQLQWHVEDVADPATGRKRKVQDWTPATQDDVDLLAAYRKIGIQAQVRFTGKGSASEAAYRRLLTKFGQSTSVGDLGTASREAIDEHRRMAAHISREQAKGRSRSQLPKASRKVLAKHEELTKDVDKLSAELKKLEDDVVRTEAEVERLREVHTAKRQPGVKRPRKTTRVAQLTRAEERYTKALDAFKDRGMTVRERVAKLTRQRDDLVGSNRKVFRDFEEGRSPTSIEGEKLTRELSRVDAWVSKRNAVKQRRQEALDIRLTREADTAVESAEMAFTQRKRARKFRKVGNSIAGDVVTVRESLTWMLQEQKQLMQARLMQRGAIQASRNRERAMRQLERKERLKAAVERKKRIHMRKTATGLRRAAGRKMGQQDTVDLVNGRMLGASDEAKAVFIHGILSNVEGLDELMQVLERHGELIESLTPGMMTRMHDAAKAADLATTDPRTGQKWVDVWVGRTKSTVDPKSLPELQRELDDFGRLIDDADAEMERIKADAAHGDNTELKDHLERYSDDPTPEDYDDWIGEGNVPDADDPTIISAEEEALLRETESVRYVEADEILPMREEQRRGLMDSLDPEEAVVRDTFVDEFDAAGRDLGTFIRSLRNNDNAPAALREVVEWLSPLWDDLEHVELGIMRSTPHRSDVPHIEWLGDTLNPAKAGQRIDARMDAAMIEAGVDKGSYAFHAPIGRARSLAEGVEKGIKSKPPGQQIIMKESAAFGQAVDPYVAVVHEAMHAALTHRIHAVRRTLQRPSTGELVFDVSKGGVKGTVPLPASAKGLVSAVQDLQKLWKHPAVRKVMREIGGDFSAPMRELNEFPTYALTDPRFIEALQAAPHRGGDMRLVREARDEVARVTDTQSREAANVAAAKAGIESTESAIEGMSVWDKFREVFLRMLGKETTAKKLRDLYSGLRRSERNVLDAEERLKVLEPRAMTMFDEIRKATVAVRGEEIIPEIADAYRAATSKHIPGIHYLEDLDGPTTRGVGQARRRRATQLETTSTMGAARQKAARGKRPALEKWKVPKDLADEIVETDAQWFRSEESKQLLRLYDIAMNTFKELVTIPFPAFHARNAYANIAAIQLDIGMAALNPMRHKTTIDILSGADGTIKLKNGQRMTYDHVRSLLDAEDIVVDRSMLLDLVDREGRDRLFVGNNRFSRPIRKHFLDPMGRTGQRIEGEARALHFVTLLERGYTSEVAAERVKRFLFDYGNLSSKEKTYMRRIFPFYTWQSKNIRNQIRNLYETPGRVSAQVKPFRERGPMKDSLPEYLRGELQVGLEGDRETPVKAITNIDFPVTELSMLWRGSLDKTFLGMINQINPLLKAPIEVAFNMDSFNGRTVNGRQWMGRNGPFMWNKFPKPLRDYFELEQTRRADGSVGYTANGTKVHLVFKSWALGRILNTASLTEMFGDTSGNLNENAMFSVWKLLTGMEFREFDLNTAHKEMLRNRIDRLETELIDRGVMRQFTKVYQPKLAPVVGGR